MIYSGKRNPKNTKISEYFIMIYQGLKPNVMYWEFVNTLRKIVILVSLLFPLTVGILISISMLILTARLEIWLKPYKNHEHYKAEFLAIMAGVTTISSALIFSMNEQHTVLNSLVFVAIVFLNLKFLIEWLHLISGIFKDKNSSTQLIYQIISKLLCKSLKDGKPSSKALKSQRETLPQDLPSKNGSPKKKLIKPKKYRKKRSK